MTDLLKVVQNFITGTRFSNFLPKCRELLSNPENSVVEHRLKNFDPNTSTWIIYVVVFSLLDKKFI